MKRTFRSATAGLTALCAVLVAFGLMGFPLAAAHGPAS